MRVVIDDENYYDYLKVIARFVHDIGYAGLLVNLTTPEGRILALAPRFASPPPELWGTFYRLRHSEIWFRRLVDPASWVERDMGDEVP